MSGVPYSIRGKAATRLQQPGGHNISTHHITAEDRTFLANTIHLAFAVMRGGNQAEQLGMSDAAAAAMYKQLTELHLLPADVYETRKAADDVGRSAKGVRLLLKVAASLLTPPDTDDDAATVAMAELTCLPRHIVGDLLHGNRYATEKPLAKVRQVVEALRTPGGMPPTNSGVARDTGVHREFVIEVSKLLGTKLRHSDDLAYFAWEAVSFGVSCREAHAQWNRHVVAAHPQCRWFVNGRTMEAAYDLATKKMADCAGAEPGQGRAEGFEPTMLTLSW